MARSGNTSPTAIIGLLLAAGTFAATLYLNQNHSQSSLIMTEQRDGQVVEAQSIKAPPQEREAR